MSTINLNSLATYLEVTELKPMKVTVINVPEITDLLNPEKKKYNQPMVILHHPDIEPSCFLTKGVAYNLPVFENKEGIILAEEWVYGYFTGHNLDVENMTYRITDLPSNGDYGNVGRLNRFTITENDLPNILDIDTFLKSAVEEFEPVELKLSYKYSQLDAEKYSKASKTWLQLNKQVRVRASVVIDYYKDYFTTYKSRNPFGFTISHIEWSNQTVRFKGINVVAHFSEITPALSVIRAES